MLALKLYILILMGIFCWAPFNVFAASEYKVQASINDNQFVINGKTFGARMKCPNINNGDTVIFIEGNAEGRCTKAKIKDVTTGVVCKVWCQEP